MTDRQSDGPAARPAGRNRPATRAGSDATAIELSADSLDKLRGGAVPFHRIINNTIYGANTAGGDVATTRLADKE